MTFELYPFDEQTDSGFCSMATAFKRAAEGLAKGDDPGTFMNGRLPICCLYRHSIELFLKSSLIVIHRVFELKDLKSKSIPEISVSAGKKKSITASHSLTYLFAALVESIDRNGVKMQTIDKKPWKIPDSARERIAEIAAYDEASDFFRYPVSKAGGNDDVKSWMKEVTVEEQNRRIQENPTKEMTMLVVDENNQPVKAFRADDSELERLQKTAADVAETLADVALCIRYLYGGGR